MNYKLLRGAIRKALFQQRVRLLQLVSTARRLGPRRGTANLNRILATRPAPTQTVLEDVVLDLIIEGGLARPVVNGPLFIAGRRVVPDFAGRASGSLLRPTAGPGMTIGSSARTTPNARRCSRRTGTGSSGSRGIRRSSSRARRWHAFVPRARRSSTTMLVRRRSRRSSETHYPDRP